MDSIPQTADEFIRSGVKNPGPDQAVRSSGDFSLILARKVGQVQNPRAGDEDGGGTSTSRRPEASSGEESPKAETSRDTTGKPDHGDTKNEAGRSAANPLDAGTAGAQAWALGFLPNSAGMDLGTLAVTGPAEAAPGTVATVGLSSSLAGEIAARYLDQGGVQTLTLRLDPAHLGKVDVTMVAKGDHLTVRLEAGNPEAETALRENLKDLTDAIGARTGRFNLIEVKVESKAQSGNAGRNETENPDDQPGRNNGRGDRDQNDSPHGGQEHTEAMKDPEESGSRTQGG